MKIPFLFMLCIFFLSCNQKQFDSKEAILKYLQDEDNGYIHKKTVNGVDFSLMYRPTDLVVSQMLQSKSINEIDSLRKKYANYLYFNLSMSKNNQEILNIMPKNRNEYGIMVNQLAFAMEKKIHLIDFQKDTINMEDYIFSRMYGMGKSNTILLVYPKTNSIMKSETITFIVEDIGVNTGEIKFKFYPDIINSQPMLNFKNI